MKAISVLRRRRATPSRTAWTGLVSERSVGSERALEKSSNSPVHATMARSPTATTSTVEGRVSSSRLSAVSVMPDVARPSHATPTARTQPMRTRRRGPRPAPPAPARAGRAVPSAAGDPAAGGHRELGSAVRVYALGLCAGRSRASEASPETLTPRRCESSRRSRRPPPTTKRSRRSPTARSAACSSAGAPHSHLPPPT